MGDDTASRQQSNSKNYYTSSCSLCYHVFKDPRLLECYHTFCSACLEYHIDATSKKGTFACPMCKDNFTVPENGVENLPRNYYIQSGTSNEQVKCDICGERTNAEYNCADCRQNYCMFCLKFHSKLQGTKDHRVISVNEKGSRQVVQNVAFCTAHPEVELRYFCDTCKILICSDCNMTNHKTHKCKDLADAATKFRNHLSSALSPREHDTYIQKMKDRKREIFQQKKAIQEQEELWIEKIENRAQELHRLVDKVKSELVDEMIKETDLDLGSSTKVTEEANSRMVSFSALFYFNNLLLKQGSNIDIVIHGEKMSKKLMLLNVDDQRIEEKSSKLEFKLETLTKQSIKDLFGTLDKKQDQNTYQITNKVNEVCQFSCKPCDAIVTGIAALSNNKAWVCLGMEGLLQLYDTTGQCLESLDLGQKLDDIAIDTDDVLYVTCSARKKVLRIKDGGQPETYIKTKTCARGITTHNSNSIIVGLTEKDVFYNCSDYPSASLIKVTNDCQQKKVYGKNCMKYPARIATSNCSKILVADWIDLKIIIVDFEGNQLAVFDGSGNGDSGQDIIPRGVCCSSDDDVFVVDTGSDSILKLNLEGKFLEKFVSVNKCWSLDYDKMNRLWVGTQDGMIHVFEI